MSTISAARWTAQATFVLVLLAVGCSESNGSSSNTADAASVRAGCEDYCATVEQAGCSDSTAGDCTAACSMAADALGACLETWRAMTRCMAETGLTCIDAGVVPADSCTDLVRQHRDCLEARANAN